MRSSLISKLGLGYRFDQEREILSMIYLCYFSILLFLTVAILLHSADEALTPMAYRYHFLIILNFLQLLLIRFRLFNLVKFMMLGLNPVILIILPILAGVSSDEFYFWFPYVPIALSIVPHFILHTYRERRALIISLVLYFLLAIFIPGFLIRFSDQSEKIVPIVLENRFYYGFIPVIIYVFVNLALGLVFAKNYEYEQIMLQQQDELIQAEKMASLGILTTGIAHEINNPMNFISGGIHATGTLKNELLKLERELTPEKKKIFDQIDRIMDNSLEGVQRVTDIVGSLKFFGNPGKAGKQHHDLEKLLYSTLLHLDKTIPDHIILRRNIPPGTTIYCYDEQLQQVFVHILLNATQVLEDSKTVIKKIIEITAAPVKNEHGEFTCISISNNGPPIPEKELKKIYDPFYTIDNSGTRKGLGMAISYMIIREHKGWIEARNEKGLVIFDIMLPGS